MKRKIRILCTILTVVFSVAFMSGCTSGDVEEVLTDVSTEEATEPQNSWEIDQSPFDVEWYVGLSLFQWKWDSEKTDVHMVHKENTGLNNVIFHVPISDANEELNTMIASGTLPDVITLVDSAGMGAEQIDSIKKGELVYDLKELSEKYAPDFIKNIAPSFLNWHGDESGKFYAFVNLVQPPESMTTEIGELFNVDYMMLMRQDMADQLNIKGEDFNTQDKMVESLKKVKAANLKKNGVNVELITYSGAVVYESIAGIAQFFGLSDEDEEGNYVIPIKNPKYLEMLMFLNRLYREGILTQKNLLAKTDDINQLIRTGNVFMMFGEASPDLFANSMKKSYAETEDKERYVAVEPVRSSDGSMPWQAIDTMKGYTHTFISKSTKIPDRLIRLFDYLHNEETMIMDQYGIDGVHYDMDNGKVKFRDEVISLMQEDRRLTNYYYGFPDIMFFFRDSYMNKYKTKSIKLEDIMLNDFKKVYNKYLYTADPLSEVGAKAGTPYAVTASKIRIEVNSKLINLITADSEEKCVQLYNEILKKIEELDYNDLYEHLNTQFKAAKQKMGVNVIYPQSKN